MGTNTWHRVCDLVVKLLDALLLACSARSMILEVGSCEKARPCTISIFAHIVGNAPCCLANINGVLGAFGSCVRKKIASAVTKLKRSINR